LTARDQLIEVLREAQTDYLRYIWPDASLEEIADHILTGRDEETLNAAADAYEKQQATEYPGPLYGTVKRMAAYKVGTFLRDRADEATGHEGADR
jgi:hypothetical protein